MRLKWNRLQILQCTLKLQSATCGTLSYSFLVTETQSFLIVMIPLSDSFQMIVESIFPFPYCYSFINPGKN